MQKSPSAGAPSGASPRGPAGLWVIRLVILVAFLDLFMQFPVVAPYARELGASAIVAGVVVAIYSATNLAGNVAAGAVLDRWGRGVPVMFGLVSTAVVLVGYVFSRSPEQLMVARALHGLTASILTPGAFAILGDAAPAGKRARVMGLSGAFIAVAAMIGPLTAGLLRDRQGSDAVFLLSAGLMLVTTLLLWRWNRSQPLKTVEPREAQISGVSIGVLWRRPQLATSYLAALALTVGLGVLVTHFPAVMAERAESSARTGLGFTAFAAVAMIGMASPLSRLSDRYGRLGPIVAGLLLVAAGMAILGASGDFFGSALGMGVFGLGFGLLFPAITALTAEAAAWTERGKAFGLFYAVFSLGVVIGSLVSGLLAQRSGINGAPFFFSAGIALASIPAIAAVWRLRTGRPRAGPAGGPVPAAERVDREGEEC
ncbi:MAG: MFS transporter [Dehalococcoidia bacterium]|nr:MFS transporter [Dehalococcoidia bacterium]